MRGGERVSPLRDGRETGQLSIEGEPESFAARVAQGQETGLCGACVMSVGRDELHRTLKLSLWDRGILGRYFLIRSVVDAVARELLPVPRPIAAESAVTVINQQRSRNGRLCSGIGGLIFRCLLHDIYDDCCRVTPRRL